MMILIGKRGESAYFAKSASRLEPIGSGPHLSAPRHLARSTLSVRCYKVIIIYDSASAMRDLR